MLSRTPRELRQTLKSLCLTVCILDLPTANKNSPLIRELAILTMFWIVLSRVHNVWEKKKKAGSVPLLILLQAFINIKGSDYKL